MSDSDPKFHPLSGTNYPQWSGEMQAWLMTKGLWRLVSGAEKCPGTDAEAIEKWELRAEKAAGALYLNVTKEQRIHLDGIIDDPVKIWEKLAIVHVSKKPGTRFNAYDDFFSIRKKEDESLQSLMTRIDEGMHQRTRPSSGMLSLLKRSIAVVVLKSILPCILRLPLPIAPAPILTAIIATNPPPLLAFSVISVVYLVIPKTNATDT
ncbi:hypothetical protein SERLA73DRAFT_107836 [Serpula lacrymans var. lacrymans S7.3]|uniref:DUF4219 domain-containing protein n=2 Tax=Serpula lacrymans var. lacrymans (strain S7.3) TaxID=936435 RepID=F8PXW2_SERL3|nr:hypothetical protein SERLA73DRAFT_107836 [Serpula lacrymans var. lacrymans S7.3]